MIKAIIIEDEKNGRDFLKNMLDEFCPEVELLAMAESIRIGKEAIRKHKPDLVFLDIKMPRGTGFDLLESLQQLDFDVIFTTAYDTYALKAIKFSAMDYLLKPIDPIELTEAVEKVIKKRGEPQNKMHLQAFINNINSRNVFNQIALPTIEGLIFVRVEEIVRCQAEGSYTRVFLLGRESVIVSKILRDIENLLTDSGFFRVHKSHLINLNHIRKYVKGSGGSVTMSDSTVVEVAKRKKDPFIEKLNNHSS